ncbi:MAG: hypothetical protein A3G24_16240 [Betaproteobacteria bacterium RIFCSPLOWO2_12_FULL_62_13]|nr:MAG: hypothetical protein A3G24_16240 [Betaproteobacteria bacterium RIFCSPLOWO2_12_FULL_62_13]
MAVRGFQTSETDNDGHYEVFWPRSQRQSKIRPLARRLDTLAGKKIAFLWDFLFRGDEVFAVLEEELKARFPGTSFVNWREFGNTHGTDERKVVAALPERFQELGVDAAISGMGC